MQTPNQEVAELLKHLPDDSTHEDIQYYLHVLEKIRKGQDDSINQGRTSSHAEAKERMGRWVNRWFGNGLWKKMGSVPIPPCFFGCCLTRGNDVSIQVLAIDMGRKFGGIGEGAK